MTRRKAARRPTTGSEAGHRHLSVTLLAWDVGYGCMHNDTVRVPKDCRAWRKTADLSRENSVRARLLIACQYTELLVVSLSYSWIVVKTTFNSGRILGFLSAWAKDTKYALKKAEDERDG